MKVLITGASGHLGTALTDALVRDGCQVVALSRSLPRRAVAGVQWVQHDMGSGELDWHQVLQDVGIVYHLAWSTVPFSANLDPAADLQANVAGSIRLAEAAANRGSRLVFASSGGTVYGTLMSEAANEAHQTRPTSFYGSAKLAVETYLQVFAELRGLSLAITRIANLYGPGQSPGRHFGAIATFAARISRGEEIVIWGDGTIIRDYVYITDVVAALRAIGDVPSAPQMINVGSGEGRSLNDILRVLGELARTDPQVRYGPARGYDVPISILDVSRAETALGWRPTVSFEAGLAATYKALLARP